MNKWCNHTEVTTRLQLGKKFYFILPERPGFHMFVKLLLAVHASTLSMLSTLSVDEILLPRYVNWSTNFK